MRNYVLEAIASLARLAVHFDATEEGDQMRALAVKAREQHDLEWDVVDAAKTHRYGYNSGKSAFVITNELHTAVDELVKYGPCHEGG